MDGIGTDIDPDTGWYIPPCILSVESVNELITSRPLYPYDTEELLYDLLDEGIEEDVLKCKYVLKDGSARTLLYIIDYELDHMIDEVNFNQRVEAYLYWCGGGDPASPTGPTPKGKDPVIAPPVETGERAGGGPELALEAPPPCPSPPVGEEVGPARAAIAATRAVHAMASMDLNEAKPRKGKRGRRDSANHSGSSGQPTRDDFLHDYRVREYTVRKRGTPLYDPKFHRIRGRTSFS